MANNQATSTGYVVARIYRYTPYAPLQTLVYSTYRPRMSRPSMSTTPVQLREHSWLLAETLLFAIHRKGGEGPKSMGWSRNLHLILLVFLQGAIIDCVQRPNGIGEAFDC